MKTDLVWRGAREQEAQAEARGSWPAFYLTGEGAPPQTDPGGGGGHAYSRGREKQLDHNI